MGDEKFEKYLHGRIDFCLKPLLALAGGSSVSEILKWNFWTGNFEEGLFDEVLWCLCTEQMVLYKNIEFTLVNFFEVTQFV